MAKKHTTMAAAAPDPFGNATSVAESIVSQMKGEVEETPIPPVTKPDVPPSPVTVTDRATSGAAAGCKPGMTRQSYVVPVDLPGKIKALAGHLGVPASTLAAEILSEGVAAREKEFWKRVSSSMK